MLGINYIVTTNNQINIFFHKFEYIGHYDNNSKELYISIDYRQEAIKYLNSVGLKVKQ